MAIFLPNGLGDFIHGDTLGTTSPLQCSGNVWYVDSDNGTDAASPAGLNASRPLDTLAQAISNAAAHDIIVLLGTHNELLTSAVTINKTLTIIGAEALDGLPSARLRRTGGAAVSLLSITAEGVELRNIRFPVTQTSAVATERIAFAAEGCRMVGCYVESGEYDTGPAVLLGAGTCDHFEARNCDFASTSETTPPESLFKTAGAVAGLTLRSCSFSGGSEGFSNPYAVDLSAAAITRLRVEALNLELGADVKVHASSTGYVQTERATGSSRVDW